MLQVEWEPCVKGEVALEKKGALAYLTVFQIHVISRWRSWDAENFSSDDFDASSLIVIKNEELLGIGKKY